MDSAEYLDGDWLSASFNVYIDKVEKESKATSPENYGKGTFHIALTSAAGRKVEGKNYKEPWYEIGKLS